MSSAHPPHALAVAAHAAQRPHDDELNLRCLLHIVMLSMYSTLYGKRYGRSRSCMTCGVRFTHARGAAPAEMMSETALYVKYLDDLASGGNWHGM